MKINTAEGLSAPGLSQTPASGNPENNFVADQQIARLGIVKPKLLVCLGSTAGQAIFGPSFRVLRERGKLLSSKIAPKVVATVHPSSLLRQPDEESRHREYRNFVTDLRVALKAAGEI